MVKRLNAASNLLIQTDLSIREIVKQSGFGSVATFNRIFREQKHCTPSQFRTIYGVYFPRGDYPGAIFPDDRKG